MNLKVTIEKVDNGYLVRYPDELDDGTEVEITEVIENNYIKEDAEEYKTTDLEKISLARMLELVAEKMGYFYGKYERDNLNIKFDKIGYKLDEKDLEGESNE